MSDIVDRLRGGVYGIDRIPLCAEAANHIEAQAERVRVLREALRQLDRAYVRLLENGRDRIRMLGGQCDALDVMEASDPNLRAARAALEAK